MSWFEDLGGALGIRRKKTLADKVQDAAENVVETVQDLYETAVESVAPVVAPVIAKSGKLAYKASDAAYKASDRARDTYELAADRMGPALKTAILVGVAYAGWQWLQSRQSNNRGYDSSGGYRSYNSTYGSVSAPSNPAPVGAS